MFQDEVAHAPVTPAKAGQPDPNMMCKTWPENPFNEVVFEKTSLNKSSSFWNGNFGSTSQTYENSGGMFNKFSLNDLGTWKGVSCEQLLAFADAGGGSGGSGQTQQCGLINLLCDLNSPPQTAEQPPAGLSLQFTPLTPDQTKSKNLAANKDDSALVEGNQETDKRLTEQTDLNETPQPGQKRRRKHRPKVVTEGNPKRTRKPATPKPPDGSSTGKRKYVRRKGVEKSTTPPAVDDTSGVTHPSPDEQPKKTCKRKIDFDESEKQAEVSPSPITPSKTELPRGRVERNYTKAKCKINFLQETHDKVPSHIPSAYESGCSTSVWNNVGISYDLESFLSRYTDNSAYMQSSAMSNDGYMQTCGQKSKRTKIMTHDSVSFGGYQQQYAYYAVPSMYHNRLGYNPYLRRESSYNIDALISLFERLHISRKAVVRGYHEKNALVVYKQDRSLVPYEGLFNPMKKKKQRPKVDLDDETNRVWMLLLEDINSEGIDGTNEDKAKWWEEERRVFRGRADSFIARMHLVQGDRRFSQWKGSVLDSVVGVFLTQNVSDHLSSSAFMSLAARYPLKKNTNGEPFHEEPCQVDESVDHDPIPMMLQEVDSCEEKETVDSTEFSKSCVISVDLNDKSECEVVQVYEIASSQNSAEQTDGCKADVGGRASFVEFVYERKSIQKNSENYGSEESGISAESASQTTDHMVNTISSQASENNVVESSKETVQKVVEFHSKKNESCNVGKEKTGKAQSEVDWDKLRFEAEVKQKRERTTNTMDSMDYEAIRKAHVDDVADAIKERGMNNRLAARIKAMLDRIVNDHGSIDLEWLRDVPPDKAKEYLLSFRGLGLKSVECIRLLTLHHLAFPVDTNVGRIAVRLGWVPLQALPESLQLHLLELYPIQESIQKYLWPRLCKLDQKTLYELHYQMITFGKVFCTKTKPNCNACPLRAECRHFASAFASARLALPAPPEGIANSTENKTGQNLIGMIDFTSTSEQQKPQSEVQNCNLVIEEPSTLGTIVEVPATPGPMVEVRTTPEPIVEMPTSPEPEQVQQEVYDLEDFGVDNEEIPMIKLNIEEFTQNLQTYMERHMELAEGDMSKALVALTSEAASIPAPKLKNISQLRTEHQVYELPDSHPLLAGHDTREIDDPCPYLLAIWTAGETPDSIQPPQGQCCSQESGTLCDQETCFFCNSAREANNQTVRGTLLIPCRTANRGSFPLNGTYFQVNEVFADHESSLNPIDVPRAWLWNLPKRTVYFGTSIPTIFKGLTTDQIQYCFWRGFICVRGFDRKERAPRPLRARLHIPASRLKTSQPKTDEKEKLMQ